MFCGASVIGGERRQDVHKPSTKTTARKNLALRRFEHLEGLIRSARNVFFYREIEEKVELYQLIGGPHAREPISNESLILAQNQRWRRA
jgi:hypothetical protein